MEESGSEAVMGHKVTVIVQYCTCTYTGNNNLFFELKRSKYENACDSIMTQIFIKTNRMFVLMGCDSIQ